MSGASDEDLIARVLKHDDREAYGKLVHRHQSTVRSFLRKLSCGDAALADDLAQDTFLRAYLKLGSFRGDARFSTWLVRIAYNRFLAEVRRSAKRIPSAELDGTAASRRSAARPSLLGVDLERAMQHLTEDERAAIVLCYTLERTHQEAASILDCPIGTVKTHIFRGKEKLRSRLDAWKGEVSNG